MTHIINKFNTHPVLESYAPNINVIGGIRYLDFGGKKVEETLLSYSQTVTTTNHQPTQLYCCSTNIL